VGVAAAVAVTACQEVRVPFVYRIDVQQGNVITQEQLAALEAGMDKRKVRFILGTPLVTDAFNQDRWDYYYSYEKNGDERVQRLVSVFFEEGQLVRVGGDVRPARGPIVLDARKDELVTVPEGYRDEGILAALTPGLFSRRQKFTPPEGVQAAAAQPEVLPTAPSEPPPPVEVTPEDERYLRELLDGFGAATPARVPAAAPSTSSEPEEDGLLSRWARQLGIGGNDASPPTPRPESAAPEN
jgi:outer membrane protein assembly factor BamE